MIESGAASSLAAPLTVSIAVVFFELPEAHVVLAAQVADHGMIVVVLVGAAALALWAVRFGIGLRILKAIHGDLIQVRETRLTD